MASTNSNVATVTVIKNEELSLPSVGDIFPDIVEPTEIRVADNVKLCTQAVEDLLRKIHNYRILGMDCEWLSRKGRRPVALIQFATSDGLCILIRTSKFPKILPDNLKNMLQDDSIIKIGSSIKVDMLNLYVDYKIKVSSCLDISSAAKSLGLPGGPLKKMAKDLLDVCLDKDKSITCSNWEANTLSDQQKQYAALDALMPLKIIEKIMIDKVSRRLDKAEAWDFFLTTWPKEAYVKIEYLSKEEYRLVKEERRLKQAEKFSQKPFILVIGVPFRSDENLTDIVKIICEKLNVCVEDGDIKAAHRIWSAGIFVELSDYNKKMEMITNGKTLELNTDMLDMNIHPTKKIFIEDKLNKRMDKLYKKALGLKTSKLVQFVWPEGGFVFVQKDENSPPWKITSEKVLNERIIELRGNRGESKQTIHNGSEESENPQPMTRRNWRGSSNRGNRSSQFNFDRNQAYHNELEEESENPQPITRRIWRGPSNRGNRSRRWPNFDRNQAYSVPHN